MGGQTLDKHGHMHLHTQRNRQTQTYIYTYTDGWTCIDRYIET